MASINSSNTLDSWEGRLRRLPPFQAVLEGWGPPSATSLQFYLSDLDNKLEENSRQLDSCLQALLRFTNDLPGERTLSSPRDGLLHIYNSHVLEKDSCYDPETDEAVIILDALLQQLDKQPGCEEDILQEVLGLSSAEGLLLPLRVSSHDSSEMVMSSSSLHGLTDPSDQIIEQRWNRLSSRLKKYFCEQLLQLPNAPKVGFSTNFCLDRRLELVESLHCLCSDEDTWQRYRSLRTQQLEETFTKLLPEVDEEHVSHKDFSNNCGIVADAVIAMIDEDFVILSSGVFRKATGVFRALHELYLEKFSDEMSLLVDEIGDEIARATQRPLAPSKSEHGLHKNNVVPSSHRNKEPPHRNSVGAVASLKDGGPVNRTQAQSLDSMFTVGTNMQGDVKMDLQKRRLSFPNECMHSLLSIIKALMLMEDHVDSLMHTITWDITALAPKKARRKASIRGVLKPTSSPEAKRYSIQSLQQQHSDSFSSSDTQLDVISNTQHGDSTAAPKVVEHSRSEERCKWEWKLVFKKLSGDLSQAVETTLLDQMQASLGVETQTWEQQHTLRTVAVDVIMQGGKMDYPKVISEGCHQFLEVVDRLLPLARAGYDSCLMPVRNAFLDTMCICLKNFHVHLVKMSKDVPAKATLKQLYVMVSTSVMIRNNLHHYENLLTSEEGGKKVFAVLLRQFSELIDALMKQAVQLHSQMMATSILFDADSTDWSSYKDFYEDERCSFPVQMWNFHLRALRYDLWSICPPHLAQNIFSSVLHDSLLSIMQRYVHVRPSFRRIKQYRYDITAVLLCVLDHLFSVCNSLSKLLDPGHGQLPQYSIHNLACNLLAALAVIGAPLETLYRLFKNGFANYRESLARQDHTAVGNNTQWMHWLWPALFQPGHKHYDDMQTTSALFLQLTLLLRQPQPNWGLLVQALLMKDYTLSSTLLTRSMMQASAHHSHSESLDTGADEAEASEGVEPSAGARSVIFAIITLLAHAHQHASALAKCILPAVERCDDWEIFNIKVMSPERRPPLWLEAVFQLLEPLIDKILEAVLFFLLKEHSLDSANDSMLSHIHDLPCGCSSSRAQTAAAHRTTPAKDLIQKCLQLMIEESQQNMYSLSQPLCCLFHTLQAACAERNIQTTHSCVGIQIVAWAVWTKMRDAKKMEQMVGLPVAPSFHQHLVVLADLYFQVMTCGKAKGSQTPRLAMQFQKTHKDWLSHKLDILSKYLSQEMFHDPETDILEGATTVFADQVAQVLAVTVLATPQGPSHMQALHSIIRNNSAWLFKQLDITSPLAKIQEGDDSIHDQKAARFHLKLVTDDSELVFNPTAEFNKIGESVFDQEAIANFPFDWYALLTSDLGLSEAAFLNLLSHRFEMQLDAELTDAERRMVDNLRSTYSL
ncbi:uncharacterized protein KIAA0825-like isoform X3 [Pomacea canaliculata]|uniref:uncharacterized protein KIAA0825-like isoform X3 n=1 Tax=Pomacea canaliculata TaxID=400727 RepID=UPI000D73B1A0|nr:uncharacterized protein KIAA0825-like isoform X3 [Pomacea canaliculata]